jgi:putative transposase
VKALLSTFNWLTLATSSRSPQWPLLRLNRLLGITPRKEASSPVSTQERATCQALFVTFWVLVERVNQVWSADITYVPMRHGFMYLVAVLDWFSRFVLAWQRSNTLDGAFCQGTGKGRDVHWLK